MMDRHTLATYLAAVRWDNHNTRIDGNKFWLEHADAIIQYAAQTGETRRDVNDAVGEVVINASNFPHAVRFRILGQDMAPLREKITDAVMAALGIKETA